MSLGFGTVRAGDVTDRLGICPTCGTFWMVLAVSVLDRRG